MIVCGKYLLDQRLVGELERYAATQMGGAERRVALTLVPSDPTLGARVQRASTLVHQNIVRILDLERDADGRLWLVSELVSGPPLSLCTELAPKALRYVAASVLRALSHAHEQGVWNGLIAAENIQLSWQGDVKLDGFAIRTDGDIASDLRSVGAVLAPRFEKAAGGRVVGALAAGSYTDAGQALRDFEASVGKPSADELRRALIPPRRTSRKWIPIVAAVTVGFGVVVGVVAAWCGASDPQPEVAIAPSRPMVHLDIGESVADASLSIDAAKNQLVLDMGTLMPECAKLLDEYAVIDRCLLTDPAQSSVQGMIEAVTSQVMISGDPVEQNRSCARRRSEFLVEQKQCVANDLLWQAIVDVLFKDKTRVESLLRARGASFEKVSKVCQVVILQFAALEQCKKPWMGTYGGLKTFVDGIVSAQAKGYYELEDNECRAAFVEVMSHSCAK